MRTALAALSLVTLAAWTPVISPAGTGPAAASAQEPATLRLTASPQLKRQLREAPGELAWTDLADHLTVEYSTSEALPLKRVPVELVAMAVRGGEILGRSATAPSVVGPDAPAAASELAAPDWPPAGDWFPSASWRTDGLRPPGQPVEPVAETIAAGIGLPTGAGGLVIFAAPAAQELRARFRTTPVVVTTVPRPDSAVADSAAQDSTGG